MYIDKALIKIFRDDLCKDQREIKIITEVNQSSTNKLMRKYNLSAEEFDNEKSVLNYLHLHNMGGIPKILGAGTEELNGKKLYYLDMEYFDGIRVFNVLAYIKMINSGEKDIYPKAQALRRSIISKCLERQMLIQNLLIDWARENSKTTIYPQIKLNNIINILVAVMHLPIDLKKINEELKFVTAEYNKRATVPFRDSTTKNMILYSPELYLGNFMDKSNNTIKADEKRFLKFKQLLYENTYWDIVEQKPIIDVDFSSCEHLTTPYDDPIGFSCHEIMYEGIPHNRSLVWNSSCDIYDEYGIAISFIIRFLRFGGRKLAYHIFHPNAYKYRFRYDNEKFYFKNLNDILRHFTPNFEKKTPEFIRFIDLIARYDISKLIDTVDEFEKAFPNCNRKFYIDIFPY